MRKVTIIAAAAAAITLSLSACATPGTGEGEGSTDEVIKVGVVISLSGPGSTYGIAGEQTLKLLAEKHNESDATPKVELSFVDDESQAAKALTSARSLLNDGADIILGGSISAVGVPLGEAMQADGIPYIATAVDQRITEPTPGNINSFVFQTPESQALNVAAMLDFAESEGIEKVAMVYDSTALGQGAFAILSEEAPKRDIEVVAGEAIEAEAGAAVPQLVKSRDAGAELLLVYAGHGTAPIIQRDFVGLGWDVPIIQSSEALSDSFREAAGESAIGVLAPSVRYSIGDMLPDSDPQKAVIEDWNALADAELGGAAIEQIYYWDAWAILAAGLEGLDALDSYESQEDLRLAFTESVASIKDLVGLVGIRSFSPTDHRGLSATGTMELVRLTDDGIELVD